MIVDAIQTTRLLLRARTFEDVDACLAMDLDPEVHRFLTPITDADARRAEITRRIAEDWPQEGGLWVVEWKERAGFLGWCGLSPLETRGPIELGYRYIRSAWGNGVATEAGRAVLSYGFDRLSIDPIVAVTHPDNLRSQRVLQKLGFRATGTGFFYGRSLLTFEARRPN